MTAHKKTVTVDSNVTKHQLLSRALMREGASAVAADDSCNDWEMVEMETGYCAVLYCKSVCILYCTLLPCKLLYLNL